MSKMSHWVLDTFPMDMTTDRYRNLNGLSMYLDAVADCISNKHTQLIYEVGIGSGLALIYWHGIELKAAGIEADNDVIDLALRRQAHHKIKGWSIPIVQGDAFDDFVAFGCPAQVICHEGLLEHFSPVKAEQLITHHLTLAEFVVIDIPTDRDIKPGGGFGDERLQSAEAWKQEISDYCHIKSFYRRTTAIGMTLTL